jgi:hypothetical protein
MDLAKLITISLVVAAAAIGLRAAHYWWRASNVPSLRNPDWSGEAELNRMTREADYMAAWAEAGRLNSLGARWTAATGFVSALAALVSLV